MSYCKVKNISENIVQTSDSKPAKQFEITFETPEKTDSIKLTGQGAIKATVSV